MVPQNKSWEFTTKADTSVDSICLRPSPPLLPPLSFLSASIRQHEVFRLVYDYLSPLR